MRFSSHVQRSVVADFLVVAASPTLFLAITPFQACVSLLIPQGSADGTLSEEMSTCSCGMLSF